MEQRYPQDKIQTVLLADLNIASCTGCDVCKQQKRGRDELYCIFADDMLRFRALLNDCDELSIVSPVYFSGAPSQLKALIDRLQPYYWSDWRLRKKRAAHLYVVGEGGDPHGFVPLVVTARSGLAVAGFRLDEVHDWVGLVNIDGSLDGKHKDSVLAGGRVYPSKNYRCIDPQTNLHDDNDADCEIRVSERM